MFGIGDDKPVNPWENKKSFFGGEEEPVNPWAPPPEVGVVHGIGRGFVRGMRQGVGAIGGAMQAVSPEESTVSDIGKKIEEFGAAGDVPQESKGFWEKGAEMGGMMAPLIAATVLAPEAAAIPISAGFASLFGLQQMHETEKAMKEAGLEPGMAPMVSGGATALAMVAAPAMIGRFLTKPISSLISKDVMQQTVGGMVKPSAMDLIKKAALTGLATEGIFLAQTGAVSGVEKAYGLPHDIPAELWETAKGAAAMSLMGGVVGYPVKRLLDNVHMANISKPLDVSKIPQEQQPEYIKAHNTTRSAYAEVVGRMLDHGDQPELAKAWREYAQDKINNNEPIDMNMPLDQISLGAQALQDKVARDMGLNKELDPQTVQNNETELAKDETIAREEETPLSNLENLAPKESVNAQEQVPAQVATPQGNVAPAAAEQEARPELKPEDVDKIKFSLQTKAKYQKSDILAGVDKIVAENPTATDREINNEFIKRQSLLDGARKILTGKGFGHKKADIEESLRDFVYDHPDMSTEDIVKEFDTQQQAAMAKAEESKKAEEEKKNALSEDQQAIFNDAKSGLTLLGFKEVPDETIKKSIRLNPDLPANEILKRIVQAQPDKSAKMKVPKEEAKGPEAKPGTDAAYIETPEGHHTLRDMQEHLRENSAGEKITESDSGVGVTSTGERFTTYEPWVGKISKKYGGISAAKIDSVIEKYLKTGGVKEITKKGEFSKSNKEMTEKEWNILNDVSKVAKQKGQEFEARIADHLEKERIAREGEHNELKQEGIDAEAIRDN
ncbi:MAG: hypothetical protein LLG40_13375, partial [Deltaproteobacteria bacterium]|nr:hypothetical protein [Deltaproteobacteria bacterium]